MPLTSPRYSNQGFFNATLSVNQAEPTVVFLDVDAAPDDGFPAIAAGLVDHFLMHPKAYAPVFNQILTQHYSDFPSHKSNLPGLVTPAERMQQLIKYVRMDELVHTLAYTLRQIAVTEMCHTPHLYRTAFVNEGLSPKDMRRPSIALGAAGIAAVANALDCPIEIQVVERLKTAPLRVRFHALGASAIPIILKCQDRRYEPKIMLKERFAALGALPSRTVHPITDTALADPSLAEILFAIEAKDEDLLERFEDTYRRLAVMVAAGELNKDNLSAIYIKSLSLSDASSKQTSYVGTEQGTQYFFDALIRAQRGAQHNILPIKGDEQQFVDELVHALARGIALGKIPAAIVDEQLDEELDARIRT